MEAYDLSRRSYHSWLAGDWEELFITGDYTKPMLPTGWAEMHKDILTRIRHLCGRGHNVLYAEVDTVCAAPVEVFGQYGDMMMFWSTCAERNPFPKYMNSGVIYFPSTIQKHCWEVMDEQIAHYDEAIWDYFQVATNQMYWSQNPRPVMVPELNWSPYVKSPLTQEEAKILHFHSSRGINHTIEQMREVLHSHLVKQ